MTEAALDGWGVSKRSGEARDAGGITVDGVKFDADKYYRTTGNNNFNSPYAVENYVYDATNIRLREVTFGYTFRNLLGAGKNLTAAIIGRNLFFFHKIRLLNGNPHDYRKHLFFLYRRLREIEYQ